MKNGTYDKNITLLDVFHQRCISFILTFRGEATSQMNTRRGEQAWIVYMT